MSIEETNEIWLPVKGWEGLYQVSNMGDIKSKDGILAKTPHYKNKYLSVMLCNGPIKKRVTVHRQVAIHFVDNPNPELFDEVNHENGNKNNCAASNLKWCDRSYNNKHAFDTGLRDGPNKNNFNKQYYNSKQIIAIQDLAILEFNSLMSCARYLHVSHASIQKAIKRGSECRGHAIYV